ncbi:MAG: hypothetical protein LBB45_06585 [Methanobrevibacter sp.]|jgi:putative transposase|nr:hypothetical protein [Candidatus Methanovirga basalitermitum]
MKPINWKKVILKSITMRLRDNEATFQFNIVVKYSKGKYNRNGIEHFVYAVYDVDIPLKNTFKEYRKCFGYRIQLQTKDKQEHIPAQKNQNEGFYT